MPDIPVTWRDEQTVNTTTAGLQHQPDVIQLANGNILVSWTTDDPGGPGAPAGTDIFAQIFDPLGNKIGAEIRLNDASIADNEQGARLAALPNGGFVVVYHDVDITGGDGSKIRLEEYNASGVAVSSNSVVISDTDGGEYSDFFTPMVAVSSATSVLVVYVETTVFGPRIMGKIYDSTTDTYSGQISLLAFGDENSDPQVTVLTNGNYVVACKYYDAPDSGTILYRIISPTGANVLSATFVTGTSGNGLVDAEPSIVALAGGGFAIAWTKYNGNDTNIQMRFYNAAGTQVGAVTPGDIPGNNFNNKPALVALADGSVAVIYDNLQLGLMEVTRLSATGEVRGTFNFAGGSNAGGSNAITGIGLADGRFAAVWENNVGEISMEILDSRDAPNPGVYAPDQKIVGTVGNDVVTAPDNGGIIYGWDGNDTLNGAAGIDYLDGGTGDDTLIGLAGNDSLVGGTGNDVLIGGSGADTMSGGTGNDTYFVDSAGDLTIELAAQGTDIVYTSANYELPGGSSIEILSPDSLGGTAALTLVGNNLVQLIYGNAGANVLTGGGGADQLVGLGGDDTYLITQGSEAVFEAAGGGTDIVYTQVSHALAGGQEIELLSTASNAATNALDLTGNEYANTIYGNDGINNLRGGGGNGDKLVGLGGNDVYFIQSGTEQLFEAAGGGSDVVYTNLSHALVSGQEIEILSAISNAATTAMDLTGNELANVIYANDGVNNLRGGGGADVMVGYGGNDVYYIVSGTESVIEANGGGSDVVYTNLSYALGAGQEIEVLLAVSQGATTAMNLTGNAIANQLYGNNGANVLNGAAGADFMLGYGGADTFQFTTALGGGNVDTIGDFNAVDDTIHLDDAVFAGIGGPGALSANAFVTGSQAGDADDRIIYNSATGALFFDADGTGGIAAVQFASLATGLTLTASDFQVI